MNLVGTALGVALGAGTAAMTVVVQDVVAFQSGSSFWADVMLPKTTTFVLVGSSLGAGIGALFDLMRAARKS